MADGASLMRPCVLQRRYGEWDAKASHPTEQKFFGSFFQKRTASFLTYP
jgi:hypothetical protein